MIEFARSNGCNSTVLRRSPSAPLPASSGDIDSHGFVRRKPQTDDHERLGDEHAGEHQEPTRVAPGDVAQPPDDRRARPSAEIPQRVDQRDAGGGAGAPEEDRGMAQKTLITERCPICDSVKLRTSSQMLFPDHAARSRPTAAVPAHAAT